MGLSGCGKIVKSNPEIVFSAFALDLDLSHCKSQSKIIPDLIQAASENDVCSVSAIISKGSMNLNNTVNGYAALVKAAQKGYEGVVSLLISAGVDVNAEEQLRPPLIAATIAGQKPMVSFLLKSGANLEIQDYKGFSALSKAAFKGQMDMVNFLIEKGASINAQNQKDGGTALSRAVASGDLNTVSLLLEKGADSNTADFEGYTPVMILALMFKYFSSPARALEIASLLTQYDVNLDSQDNRYGVTALFIASSHNQLDLISFLINKGATLEVPNNNGVTAFMSASLVGHKDAVSLLIKKGAEVNASDTDGFTALMFASLASHKEIVHLLEKHSNTAFVNNCDETYDQLSSESECLKSLIQRVPSLRGYLKSTH